MIFRYALIIGMILGLAIPVHSQSDSRADRRLAIELARERDHHSAAIEFRRLALSHETSEARGGYYWLASYAYTREGDSDLSDEMLDRAESFHPALTLEGSLLRADNALLREDKREAKFYYESLLDGEEADYKRYAARRLAAIETELGDLEAARKHMNEFDAENEEALEAIGNYAEAKDKSPRLGGLLGIIPGFGHFYSGEYANGARCLILNSLFIYGMTHTAQEEQWGAFAIISFFEVTWYSGSIYGGIDAAHRFNRDRLEKSVDGIEGDTQFKPDLEMAPTIEVEFLF